MPRLSRKNIRKRKSYRKQTKRNIKVRKSLKGGNLTPEPLSSSEMNFCSNFENLYSDIHVRDIYVKKGRKYNCEDLYYCDPEGKFHSITEKGLVTKIAESQNPEDYMSIIESTHGEVSLTAIKKLKPINIKALKGKKKIIISRNNSQSLLRQRSCKTINPSVIRELKKILLDKHRDLKGDKIELDKDLCHFYYNGSRNKGYLIDGSVKELRKLKEITSPRRSPARTPPRRSPARTPPRQKIVYNSLRTPTPNSTPKVNPNTSYYGDAKLGKRLQKEQAGESYYANLAFSPTSSGTVNDPSRILSLTRNNSNEETVYADIAADTTEA